MTFDRKPPVQVADESDAPQGASVREFDFTRLMMTQLSGRITRWHMEACVFPQNTAHHQWSVSVILMWITAGDCRSALLQAALLHDTGEREVGDMPSTIKWRVPALATLLEDLESEYRAEVSPTHRDPLVGLSPYEVRLLKAADYFDLWIYALIELASGNMFAKLWIQRIRRKEEVHAGVNSRTRQLAKALASASTDQEGLLRLFPEGDIRKPSETVDPGRGPRGMEG